MLKTAFNVPHDQVCEWDQSILIQQEEIIEKFWATDHVVGEWEEVEEFYDSQYIIETQEQMETHISVKDGCPWIALRGLWERIKYNPHPNCELHLEFLDALPMGKGKLLVKWEWTPEELDIDLAIGKYAPKKTLPLLLGMSTRLDRTIEERLS